ncbi:hypothetical protein LTR85_010916 [Meristemomyces frigidus]|nr:hypothetical protein LTR85_010916 [Meristemomyces frigidus]
MANAPLTPALRGWYSDLNDDQIMGKIQQSLEDVRLAPPPTPRPPKPGCYGNTDALILGYHSKRKLRAVADVLEINDYKPQKRASCMPAYQALNGYRGYKKLYGERLYASNYPSKTPNKGFLHLPGELRNTIYESVLTLNKPVEFLPIKSQGTNKAPYRAYEYAVQRPKKFLPLLRFLRLCRTVSQEASDVFYGVNEFRFTGSCGAYFLRAFMETIGPANTASLRKITLPIHWPGNSTESNDMYGRWTLEEIGRNLHRRNLQQHDNAAAIRAFSDCIRSFEEAGKLTDLTLVLPYAFSVSNVTQPEIDFTRFDLDKLKLKLLHLRKDLMDEATDETQQPLQKTVAVRSGRGGRRIEMQWADPKVFAEGIGWEYEVMRYDRKGRYPVEDPFREV